MNGQEDHFSREAGCPKSSSCRNTIQQRQRDVENDQVGIVCGCFLDDSLPIADGFDDFVLRFERSGSDC